MEPTTENKPVANGVNKPQSTQQSQQRKGGNSGKQSKKNYGKKKGSQKNQKKPENSGKQQLSAKEKSAAQQKQKQQDDDKLRQTIIHKLRERQQYLNYGQQSLRSSDFETAREMFERALTPIAPQLKTPQLPNHLEVRSQLLLCRLHCENIESNLIKALNDADALIRFHKEEKKQDTTTTTPSIDTASTDASKDTPKDASDKKDKKAVATTAPPTSEEPDKPLMSESKLWVMKAELLTRLCRFKEAGECILRGAEADQPDIIPSIHLYLHQLAENTNVAEVAQDASKFDVPGSVSELENFFAELTVMSQQMVFSVEWEQLYAAIDSPLCQSMLPSSLAPDQRSKLSVFLKRVLDWNLPPKVKAARESRAKRVAHIRGDVTPEDASTPPATEEEPSETEESSTTVSTVPQSELTEESLQAQDALSRKELESPALQLQAQSLIFLKSHFAYLLARHLWEEFPMPPTPAEDTPTVDEALPGDVKVTYFLEACLFGCRDGYDFVAASAFEPSAALSTCFELTAKQPFPTLLLNSSWLYRAGFRFVHWLANTHAVDVQHLSDPESMAYKTDTEGWQRFFETSVHAHFAHDPEQTDAVPCKDNAEDSKKFEEVLERIVGIKKKNQLMQLELDLSIPILKKYAHIMSEISGIDEDIFIYELTLPEDEDPKAETTDKEASKAGDDDDTKDTTEETVEHKTPTITSEILQQYLNDPSFEYTKPVGLPGLVQTAQFNIKPSNSPDYDKIYDRKKISKELSDLEKEVIQFQIDYKKKVFEVAGSKAEQLGSEMSTLQLRGLELTKWLRNFVKYMMARRDIEQEIVDVSGKTSHQEAMNWFEHMSNYVNGAVNILLRLIARCMLFNLVQAREQYVVPPSVAALEKLYEERKKLILKKQAGTEAAATEETKKNAATQPIEMPKLPTNPYDKPEIVEEEKTESTQVSAVMVQMEERKAKLEELGKEMGLPKLDLLPGKKIEKVEARYIELRRMVQFSRLVQDCFFMDIPALQQNEPKKKGVLNIAHTAYRKQLEQPKLVETLVSSMDQVEKLFKQRLTKRPSFAKELATIKKELCLNTIRVPVLELPIASQLVKDTFQSNYKQDYLSHPLTRRYVQQLETYFRRSRPVRDILFVIVYSTVDKKLSVIPSVYTQPNKFYACQNCDKVFSQLRCADCGLAHYCSKECQVDHWKYHNPECRAFKSLGKESLTFFL